jgi:metal-responsive CopG/Arc/MetJ family transcriptional regulator
MAARKIAISVPPEVLDQVDDAASALGQTRSGFITAVLRRVARARTEREICRRIDEVFEDAAMREEQVRGARALGRLRGAEGSAW